MQGSPLLVKPVGAVFTPLKWAKWLLRTFGIVQKWIHGAIVCDPTAGEGAFVFALLELAQSSGVAVDDELLSRLILVERERQFIETFRQRFRNNFGREFPQHNIYCNDVIVDCPKVKADLLIGNPPWVNFTDLEDEYKKVLKPIFIEYGLVADKRKLLLGSSRVDLSALIITKTIETLLVNAGEAVMFVPLSLFQNDDAHAGFRRMQPKGTSFSVAELYDFASENVFESISSRFGVARFIRGGVSSYPVPYRIRDNETWVDQYAAPIHSDNAALSILESKEQWLALKQFQPIAIAEDQIPRQGVNTCGANHVFIFEQYPDFLPSEFVFPLVSKQCFSDQVPVPTRFIVVPHHKKSGKPLSEEEIKIHPKLWDYFVTHKATLASRKGTLINSWIKRNVWWACLGVGPYCFAPIKIVWEAMGKKKFNPVVLRSIDGQSWQGNQALHCFIPVNTSSEAHALHLQLRNPLCEQYLLSFNMSGTCSWAQPGRIKKLLRIGDQLTSARVAIG